MVTALNPTLAGTLTCSSTSESPGTLSKPTDSCSISLPCKRCLFVCLFKDSAWGSQGTSKVYLWLSTTALSRGNPWSWRNWHLQRGYFPLWPEGVLPPPPTFTPCAKATWFWRFPWPAGPSLQWLLVNCAMFQSSLQLFWAACIWIQRRGAEAAGREKPEWQSPAATFERANQNCQASDSSHGVKEGPVISVTGKQKPERKLKVGTGDLKGGTQRPPPIIRSQIKLFWKIKAACVVLNLYFFRFRPFSVFNWTWQWLACPLVQEIKCLFTWIIKLKNEPWGFLEW